MSKKDKFGDVERIVQKVEQGDSETASYALSISPTLKRGKKVSEAAKKGHEGTYGTSQEKRERWKRIAECYAEVREEHPNWLKKTCEYEVQKRLKADGIEVRIRTIQRYKQ